LTVKWSRDAYPAEIIQLVRRYIPDVVANSICQYLIPSFQLFVFWFSYMDLLTDIFADGW
jgi:hypothetical protein